MHVLITHIQHPLTGYSQPQIKRMLPETTFQEVMMWYRKVHNVESIELIIDDLTIATVEME